MTFYIVPPRGTIPLAQLERYAQRRLEVLLRVASCHGNPVAMKEHLETAAAAVDSDCLIEGSLKDGVSHFTLRLACSRDWEMKSFMERAEILLFNHRISCMTAEELLEAVKPLRRLLHSAMPSNHTDQKTPQNIAFSDIRNLLLHMIQRTSWEGLIEKYVTGVTDDYIEVPFQFVSDLVASRRVVVKHGFAEVPYTKLCDLLGVVFKKLLQYGLDLARKMQPKVQEDDRMANLFRKLKSMFRRAYPRVPRNHGLLGSLSAEEVDHCAAWFPPCMKLLHNRLRARHRLKHADRIQYTLFLKEIGLPVHEAVNFWRQEYSRPGGVGPEECSHTWQNSSRRYTYSIRHLYGLEGSCLNYRSHSCSTIQAKSLGPAEVGGCPFRMLDTQNLCEQLDLDGIPEAIQLEIAELAARKGPQAACWHHLEACISLTRYQANLDSDGHSSTTNTSTSVENKVHICPHECDCNGKKCTSYNIETTKRYLQVDSEFGRSHTQVKLAGAETMLTAYSGRCTCSLLQCQNLTHESFVSHDCQGRKTSSEMDQSCGLNCSLEETKTCKFNSARKRPHPGETNDIATPTHLSTDCGRQHLKKHRLSASRTRKANPNFRQKVVYFSDKRDNMELNKYDVISYDAKDTSGKEKLLSQRTTLHSEISYPSPSKVPDKNVYRPTCNESSGRKIQAYSVHRKSDQICERNVCCTTICASPCSDVKQSSKAVSLAGKCSFVHSKLNGMSRSDGVVKSSLVSNKTSAPGLQMIALPKPLNYYQTYRALVEGLNY